MNNNKSNIENVLTMGLSAEKRGQIESVSIIVGYCMKGVLYHLIKVKETQNIANLFLISIKDNHFIIYELINIKK